MARNFRRPRPSHPIAEMNVTNLIDLGFTLLIIFMIATPLINQEQTIPVTLPAESRSPQQKADKSTHFVAISVDAKGNTYLEERPIPIGIAELRSRLRLYAAEGKPPVIRIHDDHAPPEWPQTPEPERADQSPRQRARRPQRKPQRCRRRCGQGRRRHRRERSRANGPEGSPGPSHHFRQAPASHRSE